ncbi:MAG TPA: HNH endonuclease [Solirubrobacterales bacterium]|nr:HNH endonuclease [Solirubrobacterales bacterium]
MAPLPDFHRRGLIWFSRHSQVDLPWDALELEGGQRLATAAKGIYKPAGSDYALSVSQRIGSTYDDDLVELAEGWSGPARYHQEGPTTVDAPFPRYPNEGLFQCMKDKVPVGVLVQISKVPSIYTVIGLARVADWEEGSFLLVPAKEDSLPEASQPAKDSWQPPERDEREKVKANVVRRRGQAAFRRKVIAAYKGRCAVTGADVLPALDAAHISPYSGPASDHIENGLLLRTDIHALFDLGLLAIDPSTMRCLLDSSLTGTEYADLEGRRLRLPAEESKWPSPLALEGHRLWARL